MSLPKILVAAIFGVCVLLFFQNCQKAKMSVNGSEDASLARVNETDLELPPGPNPGPNPSPAPTPTPPPTPNPDPCLSDNGDHDSNSSSDDDSHDHSRHAHHKGASGHEMCDDDSSDDRSDDDCRDPHDNRDRDYVCEIGDPRDRNDKHCLGVTDKEHQMAKNSPDKKILCMTKEACEKIGGRAFPQARASKRSYCKDDVSRGTSHVSDEKLNQLVNKHLGQ